MNLYTVAQTREIERLAIEQGFNSLMLMKRAGFEAVQWLKQSYPNVRRLYVLCGGGHNGGDGLAVAQYALLEGCQVDVALTVSPAELKSQAVMSLLSELASLGVMPRPYDPKVCAQADVIVDALIGIGLKNDLTPEMTSIIASVNAFGKPVLSLDVPSGLDADSGVSYGDAIVAAKTMTFITQKLGLVSVDGPDLSGEVKVSQLGIPDWIIEQIRPASKLVNVDAVRLPARKKNAHKGEFGQVLLVGGESGMMGAIMLASQACAHAGAGLVRVVTRGEHAPFITMRCPEVMAYGERQLMDFVERSSVVAIGPGLVANAWAKSLLQSVLYSSQPKVVDAGALRLLAEQKIRRDDWILTPHPGEAAAMLGVTTEAIQSDRLAAVVELQEVYGGVVVLKGAGTLVYDGHQAHICDFADGAVSSAGMGDVLVGIVAALLAQGLSLVDAAVEGVKIHAKAGKSLSQQSRVVLASQVVNELDLVI